MHQSFQRPHLKLGTEELESPRLLAPHEKRLIEASLLLCPVALFSACLFDSLSLSLARDSH